LPYPHLRQVQVGQKRALAQYRFDQYGEDSLRVIRKEGHLASWRTLSWDSQFFKKRMATLAAHCFLNREKTIRFLKEEESYLSRCVDYVFAHIPVEDTVALDVLGRTGWSPIEIRVTYEYPRLASFRPSRRYSVCEASLSDVPALGRVAGNLAQNPLDRFHADPFFPPKSVERLMKVWVQKSVSKEFADAVLVPCSGPSAFMALRFLKEEWPVLGYPMGQIALSAVNPAVPGWHPKLLSESLLRLKAEGAESVTMTTQAGNRPVIRACEWIGMRFAYASVTMRRVVFKRDLR